MHNSQKTLTIAVAFMAVFGTAHVAQDYFGNGPNEVQDAIGVLVDNPSLQNAWEAIPTRLRQHWPCTWF